MKSKREVALFWFCLIMWGVLAILMNIFAYHYCKNYTDLSYFWCGVVAILCSAGVIYFPLVTMINIIFTQERIK